MATNQKSEGGKKALGRPATGRGTQYVVRVQPDFEAAVDDWRSQQRPIPSFSEALRQLAKLGLKRGK